jgi:PAS domain S-box-containing protein
MNFGGWTGRDFHNHVFILTLFPVLIWVGLRLNRAAATIASLILGIFSVYGTAQGYGPFVHEGTFLGLIALAAFLSASTLTLLILSVALSDRRIAESQLIRQSSVLENILKHLPGAVYWKSQQGIYLGCNLEFAELAGLADPKDLIGKRSFELPNQTLLRAIDGKLDEQILYTGQPRLDVEIEFERPAGNRRTVLTNKTPLRNPGGDVIGMIGTAVDITRLKLADQLVRESLHELRRIVDHLPAGAVFVAGDGDTALVLGPGALARQATDAKAAPGELERDRRADAAARAGHRDHAAAPGHVSGP